MGLGSILFLVYGASVATYNASLLIPSLTLLGKIKKDGYVSTGKDRLSNVVYNKIFTSCVAFDGDQPRWSMYALIPGVNTLLALATAILAVRNRDKYNDYSDLVYRGFITKDFDNNDKKDDTGDKDKETVTKKDNVIGQTKHMTRKEIIQRLKEEREKLVGGNVDKRNTRGKKLIIK